MKRVLFCLALAALPTRGQVPDGPIPPIAIYYEFQHEAPAPVLDSLKQEVACILSPGGPPFEWRLLSGVRAGDVSEELAVVTFKGNCEVSELVPQRMTGGSLGRTHVTEGTVLPFCDVDCDRIRAFVGRSLVALAAKEREKAFGRAVARVLSHELYHVFAQTVHHDPTGVARSSFTVKELMAPKFRLQKNTSRPLKILFSGRQSLPAAGAAVFKRSGCALCHGSSGEGSSRGPLLRAAGRSLDFLKLAARLGDKRSKMYRNAHIQGCAWPTLADADIDSLISFLNAGLE